MPELTVVMPVYNQTKFVGQAIESMLAQSFSDFEFVIMDDGSTDGTPGLLRSYARRDARVRVVLAPHRGIPATRNALLGEAGTDLVAWIDADDVAMPDRLAQQREAMLKDPELWVLGTRTAFIDDIGRVLKCGKVIVGAAEVARRMTSGCKVVQSSCMMRRDRVLSIGGYRAAFAYAQDYDLFLRVAEAGKIDNLPSVGHHYRWHSGNVSSRNSIYQSALADLARVAHGRRVAGSRDATAALTAPPPLDDAIFDELLGSKIATYRLVEQMNKGGGSDRHVLKALLFARVHRKQRKSYQRAVVQALRSGQPSMMRWATIIRAGATGPRRLLQQLRAK